MLSPLNTTVENFFIVINRQGKWFEYLIENFANLSDYKLKEFIFIGPQIREI
jgi:hypothetical protein